MESFVAPEKKVKSPMQMGPWLKSEAYGTYVGFILHLNETVKRKSTTEVCDESENAKNCVKVLDQLDSWIGEYPPQDQPQRFGNKAFRDWHKKVCDCSEDLLKSQLLLSKPEAYVELLPYFLDSFGNSTRIDYGTGHEASFAMLLCCLFKLKILEESDCLAAVTRIFQRYLKLVRKLQQTYRMEPAGSQGSWSLDDYQFLPFVWGSSQLVDHPKLTTDSFTKADLVEQYADDFLFMDCIRYINQVKSGPFAEHSNQLWNISGVPFWSKINTGLVKMYKAEVLAKFPVVQHFLFGSLLPFTPLEEKK